MSGMPSDDLLVSLSMNYNNSGSSHAELCDNLKRNSILRTPLIEYAFRKTDRKFFDPSPNPYEDKPHSIGCNATISSAHMHALALEAINRSLVPTGAQQGVVTGAFKPKTFLDVGSGSGFVTALLGTIAQSADSAARFSTAAAAIVGLSPSTQAASSKVIGVDVSKALCDQALSNVRASNPALVAGADPTVRFSTADVFTVEGLSSLSSPLFDAIHVGVAVARPPIALLASLAPGAEAVIPVQRPDSNEQDLVVYKRKTSPNGDASKLPLPDVVISPLFSAAALKGSETARQQAGVSASVDIDKALAAESEFVESNFEIRTIMRVIYSVAVTEADYNSQLESLPATEKAALNPRITHGAAPSATGYEKFFKSTAFPGQLNDAELSPEDKKIIEQERERAAAEALAAINAERAKHLEEIERCDKELTELTAVIKSWHTEFTEKNGKKPSLQDMESDSSMSKNLEQVRELRKQKQRAEAALKKLDATKQ